MRQGDLNGRLKHFYLNNGINLKHSRFIIIIHYVNRSLYITSKNKRNW